jgi:hypothetical protein
VITFNPPLPEPGKYTCVECWAACESMQAPCPECGSIRVVLTSIITGYLARVAESTDAAILEQMEKP